MDTTISAYAPAAIGLFLVLCVLWVFFRIMRALFRRKPARFDPVVEPVGVTLARQEPRLGADPPAPAVAYPANGDIAALKRSIDRLADQIGLLEQRLGGVEGRIPAAPSPEPVRVASPVPDTEIVPERPV
ncbi:MAG: hypothetical protein ABW026_16095 [Microvirga sp.]